MSEPINWNTIILAVIGALGTAFGVWIGYLTKKTHDVVNSRMTEMLAIVKSSSKAEGKLEGAADEKAKVDATPKP